MTRHLSLRRLRRDNWGASTVEFALILMPLCILIFGSLEMGYRIYAESVVNGVLRDAARLATTGGYTGDQIDTIVKNKILDFRRDAGVTITKKSYSDFTGVGVAEPITSGSVDSGSYCYQDINDNNQWDEDQGKGGVGRAEDVVYYQVDMTYKTLFSFSSRLLGLGGISKISANTVVSNEPFAAVVHTDPVTRCH